MSKLLDILRNKEVRLNAGVIELELVAREVECITAGGDSRAVEVLQLLLCFCGSYAIAALHYVRT